MPTINEEEKEEIKEELNNDTEKLGNDNSAYIEALKKMKENYVKREDFDKIKEENKMLIDALSNGESISGAQDMEKQTDINELRKELFSKEHNNLETVKLELELRKALIEKGENDPFLPYGKNIMPTNEDIVSANRVADVLQELVDEADGDPEIFSRELQRVMVEAQPNRR